MGCLFQLIVEIFLEGVLVLLTDKEERKAIFDEGKAYFREKLGQWKKK